MTNWLHRLFNPHCADCAQHDLDMNMPAYNAEAEILKSEIEFLRQENRELRNHILNPRLPTEPIISDEVLKPLETTRHKPFSVIRNELERASRLERQKLDEKLKADAAKADNKVTEIKPDKIVEEKIVEIVNELNQIDAELKESNGN